MKIDTLSLRLSASALALLVALAPASAPASPAPLDALAPGALDPAFGSGGRVTTDFKGATADRFEDTAARADGKIVAVGTAESAGGRDAVVVRFNANGSLDPTFGSAGRVVADFAHGDDEVFAVALQPDGKTVVVGASRGIAEGADFLVARFGPSGALDASFGSGGSVLTDFAGSEDAARDVAIQPDGKIVVAGSARVVGHEVFAVARYNADGSLDASFDGDGKLTTDLGASDDEGSALALLPGGKILVGGDGSFGGFSFARYASNGALEATFGSGFNLPTSLDALAIQADGKIVASGFVSTQSATGFDVGVARFAASGAVDASFDGDGLATIDFFGGFDEGEDVAIQPDGRILVAGRAEQGAGGSFGVARLNADGTPDAAFDGDGKASVAFGAGAAAAFGLALQSTGRIVVAGTVSGATQQATDAAIARLTASGTLDATFDGDGRATTGFVGPAVDVLAALAAQPDGKIVAVGSTAPSGGPGTIAVARYNPNGSLDQSFGSGGRVALGLGFEATGASAVAIQPDGKIVIGGFARTPSTGNDFLVVRLAPNGALDAAFGTGGAVTTDFFGDTDGVAALALAPGGSIVAAGSSSGGAGDLSIARFTPAGALDASFGGDGRVVLAIGSAAANAVAVQPDNRVVVAGGSGGDFFVARLTFTGGLDTNFDGDGFAVTDLGSFNDAAKALAIQPDGRIVLAGVTASGATSDDLALARYAADGSLDASFGVGGVVTADVAGGNDDASSLAIQPDGRIVTAGRTERAEEELLVARFTAAGALDDSFGENGLAPIDFGEGGHFGGTGVALVPGSARIVVAGTVEVAGEGQDFALAGLLSVVAPAPFDLVAVDDRTGDILRAVTAADAPNLGAWEYRVAGGPTFSGTAVVHSNAARLTLADDQNPSVRMGAAFDAATHGAEAVVTPLPNGPTRRLVDSDTRR